MTTPIFLFFFTIGLTLIGAESWWRRKHGVRTNWHSAILSLALGGLRWLIGLGLHLSVLVELYRYLGTLAPWHLPATWPVWLGYFALSDLWNYAFHRASHRVKFLWAAHVVHHSTEDFNFTAAARLSPIEVLWHPLLGIWALLVGVPLSVTAAWTTFDLTLALLNHTDLPLRLGCLDRWLVTPSAHRVHHGRNSEYIDKNFGTVLLVWDRLFGTYEPEVAKVQFGATNWEQQESFIALLRGGYPEWWHQRVRPRTQFSPTTKENATPAVASVSPRAW